MLFLLISLFTAASADVCSREFGRYVNCLKVDMSNSYELLENEYYSDLHSEVKRCLDPHSNLNNRRCMYTENDFNRNWFMANTGCVICNQIKSQLLERIFFEEESVRQCSVRAIYDTLYQDMSVCMESKVGKKFQLYESPDFDQQFKDHKNTARSSANLFVGVEQRMARCVTNHYGKWSKTHKCLQFGGLNIRENHCVVAGNCVDKTSRRCPVAGLMSIFSSNCDCLYEARASYTLKVRKFLKMMTESPGTVPECVRAAKDSLKSENEATDWKFALEQILFRCSPNAPTVTVERLLKQLCYLSVTRGDVKKLKLGMEILTMVIDVVLDRLARFCPCAA